MTGGFICKSKHPKNFGIALKIMAEIKRNCETISMVDTQNFSHQQQPPSLDKNSLQLWLYTLRGMGYIKKTSRMPNGNRYSLTSKGEDELQYHLNIEMHKMFIQSI
jgi:DNA-binding PadR family transcriptional regulator